MPILFWVILSTFLVSLISLIGVFTLSLRDQTLKKVVGFLVDLSIGVLMAAAFLDLIPDAIERFGLKGIFLYVLVGFFTFFLIEKLFRWRHCHEEDCPVHTFAYVNLLGETVHNFTDGLIIGASFIVDFHLGVATVLAVVSHEIPHEIGDFGILVYAGFKKTKALFFNFLTALSAIIGGIVGYYISTYTGAAANFLLPFAAGGFLYIAASDLIPEVIEERNIKKSLLSFTIAVLGILLIYVLKSLVPE